MKINPYPYPFIAIEGVDGCGKTTLMEELKKWDKAEKIGAFFTKEPTDGAIGKKIREILADNGRYENKMLSAVDLQRLFIKDRREHRKTEAVLLEARPVVSDRDFVSTLVYGIAEEVSPQWIVSAHELILGNYFFVPDLVLILDLSPDEAMKRSERRGEPADYFEERIKLRRAIHKAYLQFPAILEKFYPEAKMNIRFIDALPAPEKVFKDSLFWINECFQEKLSKIERN